MGQVDYYKSLLAEADLEPEMEEHLRELISQKNYFGVEELLKGQNLSESLSEAFAELPQMFGSVEVLEKAKKLTSNPEALFAVKRLEEIYEYMAVRNTLLLILECSVNSVIIQESFSRLIHMEPANH